MSIALIPSNQTIDIFHHCHHGLVLHQSTGDMTTSCHISDGPSCGIFFPFPWSFLWHVLLMNCDKWIYVL
jgi:hypothetical protein